MKNLNFLKDRVIAHRGVFDNESVIENTVESFRISIFKNYIIELDVRLTKDEELIVFHDSNAKRIAGLDKYIGDMDYSDVRKLNLLGTDCIVPKFVDILKLVNGKVPLLIEVKSELNVDRICRKLKNLLDSYNGEYAIQSFDSNVIKWFKKNKSDVICGLLVPSLKDFKFRIDRSLIVNPFLNIDFVSISINNNVRRIRRLRRKYFILGWTVRDKETINILKDEYDNLIVDGSIL